MLLVALSVHSWASNANDGKDSLTTENADATEGEWEVEWPDYQPWTVVRIQGKLKMKGMPVSPTLKIFMQRDSLVDISMRAPFVGEAGRLTVTPDSVIVVNKMNKTYAQESIPESPIPLGINDVQDLLLGRFFLPGHDVMNENLDELVDIYYEDEGLFNVVPKDKARIEGVKYGFLTDGYFKPLMLMILPQVKKIGRQINNHTETADSTADGTNSQEDLADDVTIDEETPEVDFVYERKGNGYDIIFVYKDMMKTFDAILELKEPEWRGDAPKAPDLSKFRRLGMEDFFRSVFK